MHRQGVINDPPFLYFKHLQYPHPLHNPVICLQIRRIKSLHLQSPKHSPPYAQRFTQKYDRSNHFAQ